MSRNPSNEYSGGQNLFSMKMPTIVSRGSDINNQVDDVTCLGTVVSLLVHPLVNWSSGLHSTCWKVYGYS